MQPLGRIKFNVKEEDFSFEMSRELKEGELAKRKDSENASLQARLKQFEQEAADAMAKVLKSASEQAARNETERQAMAKAVAELKKAKTDSDKKSAEALSEANAKMQQMNRAHAQAIREKSAQIAALEQVMFRLHEQAAKALSESKKQTQSQEQAQKKPASKPAQAQQKKPAPKPPQIEPIYYERAHAVNYEDRDRAVRDIGSALKRFPKARVILSGHADDSKYPQTNRDVSHNRASFLASYLHLKLGVSMDQITVQALGDRKPWNGHANVNRRVEILIRP